MPFARSFARSKGFRDYSSSYCVFNVFDIDHW